jgi:hypothetical protein
VAPAVVPWQHLAEIGNWVPSRCPRRIRRSSGVVSIIGPVLLEGRPFPNLDRRQRKADGLLGRAPVAAGHEGRRLVLTPQPRISPLSCSGASFSPATCRFSSRMVCCMRPALQKSSRLPSPRARRRLVVFKRCYVYLAPEPREARAIGRLHPEMPRYCHFAPVGTGNGSHHADHLAAAVGAAGRLRERPRAVAAVARRAGTMSPAGSGVVLSVPSEIPSSVGIRGGAGLRGTAAPLQRPR